MIASAPELSPTTISPCINLSCAEINSLLLFKSSARTVEIAFDVSPLIVSPLVNLPNEELSKSILSPASNCVLSVSKREESKTILLEFGVSVSKLRPSVL